MHRDLRARIRLACTALVASTYAFGALAANAVDLQARHRFEIPAQSLDTALLAFSSQTKVQLLMWAGMKAELRSAGVHGELPASEALAALLANTGLAFRQIDAQTVAIVERDKAAATQSNANLILAQAPADAASAASGALQTPEALGLEEIIVTAQKREESLEKVPTSITVFTRAQIDKSAIVKLEDYANFTPGLNAELGGDERSYNVTIRGIGRLGGQASNFGLYLDEFELTGASSGNVSADLADVERIEVLRGPQGTAFGRNVIAGAINITSIAPSHDGVFGSAEAEGGSHGSRAIRGAVNVPLIDDIAAVRLSASYRGMDGYLKNVGPTGQSNDYERTGFRAALRLTPVADLTIDGAVSLQKYEQGFPNTVTDGHLIGEMALFQQLIDAGLGALPPGSLPAGYPRYYPDQNKYISSDTRSFLNSETTLATLRAQYDFDSFSLVSVSGYVHSSSDAQTDYDYSEYNLFYNVSPYVRDNFWSTELRAQSNGTGPFGWIFGAYYSAADSDGRGNTYFGSDAELITTVGGSPLFPNNMLLFGEHILKDTTSKALFTELSYRLTDRFKVIGGLRYNDDRIEQSQVGSFNLLSGGPLADETRAGESSKVTGRLSLQYEVGASTNLYTTFARGYRAGGIQLLTPFKPTFGPEQADNYELGMKAFFFDRRLALNIAAFYTDWSDVQISTYDFSSGRNFTDNVGRANVYGSELELRALPLTGLEITAGVSVLNTEVRDFINGNGISLAGQRLPNTPNFTGTLVVDYERPLSGDLRGFVRTSYLHMSNRLESLDDPNQLEYLPSYDVVDLRLGVRSDRWMAEVFGENVFDEVYSGGVLLSGFSLTGSAVNSPRPLVGLRVSMEF
ncbi:TonB-dependent receptor [Steroidobacter sp.]|uniref:TonB-dependent receptor n=1 Tax=Steroidobacter sp. TaxID=1978227 RepID=UPI0025CBF0E1|nr:TonB-dependent receptor [Steroidobacter sp.]